MENYFRLMKEKIDDADMVLVGIGEDFGNIEKNIRENPHYHESEIKNPWILPYVYAKMVEERTYESAYINLKKMLENKNYFIISVRTDDLVYKESLGFEKEKIVTPCGGIHKLQCEFNCMGKTFDVTEEMKEQLEQAWERGNSLTEVKGEKEFLCPDCGRQLVFNQIGLAEKYCEEGYLPMWEKYTKWLQGTLNRKLCIIELGVGMRYPSVIRWPFEKMAFFNQKACMFRIHHRLYQLTEELSGKGYAIPEYPTDFLVNSFE